MNEPPRVSVVVPFYDQDEFLLEAISSVEAQSLPAFEIVVVDDCSPRASAAQLLNSRTSPGLKIVRHPANLGLGAARNTGVRLSSSDLIVSLDADDLIHPDYLKTTVPPLSDDSLAAVCTAVQTFGDHIGSWTPVLEIPDILMRPVPSTFVFRRSVFDRVGGYDSFARHSPDKSFVISILKAGYEIALIEQPLYFYRKHSGQFTASQTAGISFIENTFRHHRDLHVQHLAHVVSAGAGLWWRQATEISKLKRKREELLGLEEQYRALASAYGLRIPAPERYEGV